MCFNQTLKILLPLTLIALFSIPSVLGQSFLDTVEIDINNGSYDRNFPFDSRFRMVGDIDSTVRKIQFWIRYNDPFRKKNKKKTKKRYYLPYEYDKGTCVPELEKTPEDCNCKCMKADSTACPPENYRYHLLASYDNKSGNKRFDVLTDNGLHANLTYKLFIRTWTAFEPESKKRIKFRSEVHKIIDDKVGSYDDIDSARISSINRKIAKKFREIFPDQLIKDLHGNEAELKLDSARDKSYYYEILGYTPPWKKKKRIKELIDSTRRIRDAILPPISKNLKDLITNQGKLTEFGKEIWKARNLINKDKYAKLDFATLTRVIKDSFGSHSFEQLLAGKSVISGNGALVNTPQFSSNLTLDSYNILIAYFNLLLHPALRYSAGGHVLRDSNRYDIKTLLLDLNSLNRQWKIQAQLVEKDREIRSQLPISYENLYFVENHVLEVSSDVDVLLEADKNPYIGLDVGLGYSHQANSFYLYEGVNFYLRPVNKRTKLSALRKSDAFFKRVSFYAAVSQYLGGNSHQELLNVIDAQRDEKGFRMNLMMGAGFRWSRIARTNIGFLITKQRTYDPFDSGNPIKLLPTVNVSLEINVAEGLSSLFDH